MDPSFGSGSALLGGGDQALQQAIASRATGDAGALNQQTPASPGYQPMPQSTQAGAPQPVQSQALPGMPKVTSEPEMILKALENRLKHHSKMEELKTTGGM